MPHFDYKGVMCGMAAFKEHCAFGFWKADLILDRDKQKEKSGMGSFGCIKSLKDLPNEKTLVGYVKKAAALNEAGIKAPGRAQPKKREPLSTPDELTAALKKNAKARQTFETFSPSHRREYIEWITEAKREENAQGSHRKNGKMARGGQVAELEIHGGEKIGRSARIRAGLEHIAGDLALPQRS